MRQVRIYAISVVEAEHWCDPHTRIKSHSNTLQMRRVLMPGTTGLFIGHFVSAADANEEHTDTHVASHTNYCCGLRIHNG